MRLCARRHAAMALIALLFAIIASVMQQTAASAEVAHITTAQGAFQPQAAPPPSRPAFAPPQTAPASQPTGFFGVFWVWVQTTQAELSRELVKAVRGLKTENALAAGALLALFSFIYGVVHAVGPGHGKAVITSYVLANERTVRRGIMLAFLSALVQALSAIAIVVIFSMIMRATGLKVQETVGQLETASYALIAAIGLWMLVSAVRKRWPWTSQPPRKAAQAHSLYAAAAAHSDPSSHKPHHAHRHAHSHDHAHGEDCGCGRAHVPLASQIDGDLPWRKAAAIVFAVGIRPCTGAILVLVFALTQGLFWAGVASAFAMAIGTAITVSALAVMAVGSRDLAVRLSGGSSLWRDRIEGTAAIAGSLFILFIGLSLFFGSLGPSQPFVF
jgi:nickel/cobalt exporter